MLDETDLKLIGVSVRKKKKRKDIEYICVNEDERSCLVPFIASQVHKFNNPHGVFEEKKKKMEQKYKKKGLPNSFRRFLRISMKFLSKYPCFLSLFSFNILLKRKILFQSRIKFPAFYTVRVATSPVISCETVLRTIMKCNMYTTVRIPIVSKLKLLTIYFLCICY